VVFVHAAAGHTGQWAAQLKHLRGERRALAIDLRGHGQSRATLSKGTSIEELAADIGAVVDRLGLQRFVLVGHSMGGAVCVAYAGQHPERVAGLFLLDPASDGRRIPAEMAQGIFQALESDAWLATMEEYWAPMLEPSRPEVREAVWTSLRKTPRESVVTPVKALFRFDPVTPLKRYRGPRLSVITLCNETPDSLQQLVPDLPHQKIGGTGHWVQLDAPEEVNARLDAFLSQIR
jgi:pimeloyl-ACP methyl ester carboxylesterase